ncbi:BRO-N domain-containing protein [Azotobacter salinestris]|uniref:BRO-N domain-containing protein n=1 Tax=Azotobacter salinestris TaxID=69964 RepID=UPI00126693BA|nr:Bro-N domain-containing protein [Azotobacter salinestris]
MTSITPFQFEQHEVRVVEIDGELWWIAMDVAESLGYSDAFNMTTRLDDDEKQNLRGAGFGNRGITVINESGLYTAILGSQKPEAKRFKKWVTAEVLPTIRRTGQYQLKPPVSRPADVAELPVVVASIEIVARSLNVCESSKLQMFGAAFSRHGVDPVGLLPSYAVDAPAGHVTSGSSLPAFSLTHLLKEHGIAMSAIKANKALEQAGLLEAKQRASTKAPEKVKTFWALTGPGLQYGKNATSPSNPRETQPLFFADRFQELLDLIETRH